MFAMDMIILGPLAPGGLGVQGRICIHMTQATLILMQQSKITKCPEQQLK